MTVAYSFLSVATANVILWPFNPAHTCIFCFLLCERKTDDDDVDDDDDHDNEVRESIPDTRF